MIDALLRIWWPIAVLSFAAVGIVTSIDKVLGWVR